MEQQNITAVKGIGEKTAKLFQKIGVGTVEELLHYYPRAYAGQRRHTGAGMVQYALSARDAQGGGTLYFPWPCGKKTGKTYDGAAGDLPPGTVCESRVVYAAGLRTDEGTWQ